MSKILNRKILKIVVFCTIFVILVVWLTRFLPSPAFGNTDLRAYWSAGYLLARSDSFSDYGRMQQIQIELTGWPPENGAMMTWNPPWLFPLFIPLTWFSYDQAVWIWMIFSMLLTFLSLLWISDLIGGLPQRPLQRLLIIAIPFLSFPLIQTLFFGQITILVYIGLVGYIKYQKTHPFLSGVFLALTFFKPHLVFLLLPIIGLSWIMGRNWWAMGGFLSLHSIGFLISLWLRPFFLAEYFSNTINNTNVLLTRVTPSVPNYLAVEWGMPGLRFSGLLFIPIIIIYWWFAMKKGKNALDLYWIGGVLLLSIILAPYGYTFDFIVLLLPMIIILLVGSVETLAWWQSWFAWGAVVLVNIFAYCLQVELFDKTFFWLFPLILGTLYFLVNIWGRESLLQLNYGNRV